MLSTLIWFLVLAVIVLVGLFILTARRHKRDLASAMAQRTQDHLVHANERDRLGQSLQTTRKQSAAERDRLERSLASSHENDVMRLNELHNAKITESESSNELLKRQLDDAREFFRKGMKWDLASRNAIVSICRSLSVSGFLATNVVFDPSTTSKTEHFAAQIDHVLVTDSFVLIIENKRWKGLVFADKHPSAVSPHFQHLVDESDLQDHFAVQIVPDSSARTLLTVRTHPQRDAPCRQVRKQAMRLRDFFMSKLEDSPWIETSVFYSHPDFHFEGGRTCTANGRTPTRIAAGSQELHSVIGSILQDRHSQKAPVRTSRIGTVLKEYGADIVGFGQYKERWGKPLLPTQQLNAQRSQRRST